MAGAYSAVVSVMTVMDNLHTHPHPPLSIHPKQAESLTQHLTFFEKFLEKYDQTLPYSTEADPFETRIADAAYAAEDAIESHIVDRIKGDGDGSDDSLYEALETVIQEMTSIQKEAMEIKQTTSVGVQNQPMPLRSSSVEEKSSMVGVDDVLLHLKDKLTSDRCDRQIIPIVGMGGTGKTTLAINIYDDPLIKERFDIHAWATISQEYSIKEILVGVLRGLNLGGDEHTSEASLGEILYKYLFGRRYLIVMDDMWSIGAWDGIRRFLPDNENGSRIVVTTRLSDLASELSNSNSLKMKFLDETDSWDLLSKTVFGEEGCPPELEEIGKEISKSCKGLPLSIVVIGGFLAKSECTREFWKYTEENLSVIQNLEDYESCLNILHMSYNQLPIYLKPCFLYMGIIPEDKEIRTSKLVQLWVAEGFLKPISGGSTLEEMARVYLKDLADRNLILINETGVTGKIKSYKIHDLLRDLCLREADKERFYTLSPQRKVNGQRRIVISSTASKEKFIDGLPSMSPVRSLIWNVEGGELPLLGLRLLRIFYLSIPRPFLTFYECTKFVENVHQLVNSRFLQFSSPSPELEFPLSFWKFWNLQTLIIRGVNAPIEICYMPHLRHILSMDGIELPDPPKDQDGIVLGNLQSLEGVLNFKCSDQMVKRIPNIKVLKASYDRRSLDDAIDYFANLDRLDNLRLYKYNINRGTGMNFPQSLKKLHLKVSGTDYWEQELLDKIGFLPFLQKLTLWYGIFKDEKWETTEGQFRSLKSLELCCCRDLKVWTTESSHFPCLSFLGLYSMSYPEEIPIDFAEVSTLRELVLNNCIDSIVFSAKRILEEREELYGEADLQVKVMHWDQEDAARLASLAGPNFHML